MVSTLDRDSGGNSGSHMLRCVEEIVLLLIREDGSFVDVPSWSIDYAIAGSVLMDLALLNRIDTDLESLVLVNDSPVGDDLLDPTLAEIAAGRPLNTRYWVIHTAQRAKKIRERTLSRLVAHGILDYQEYRILWIVRSIRYPLIEDRVAHEVKQRILGVLYSDEIPDPRDVMVIALANACGIFNEILTVRELRAVAARIELISRLDLIGQAMKIAVNDIKALVATSISEQRN